MDTGISTQLMVSLATNEAAAAQFEFIEPEHMLCGLLKLAELKKQDLESSLTNSAILPELEEEQKELQRLFSELGMSIPNDTKRKRDKIRKQMGKGNVPYDGKAAIHRSDVSKEICNRAVQIAQSTGATSWKAIHVAAALKERGIGDSDEPAQKAAQKKAPPKEPQQTPLLDHYGIIYKKDNEKQPIATTKDPVVKVLREMLEANPLAAIALIEGGVRPAKDIIEETAQLAFNPDVQIQLASVTLSRIIDSAGDTLKLFTDLIKEATDAEMILCMEDLPEMLACDEKTGLVLAEVLKDHRLGCILITDPIEYEQALGTAQPWKKLLWPIWIHDLNHMAHI
jgi:hypothetical protein